VSGVIVVSAAQRSSRHQLKQALAAVSEIGSRTLGVVLTMAPTKGLGAYGYGAYGGYYGSVTENPAPASAAAR